jgi:hypothetical protein
MTDETTDEGAFRVGRKRTLTDQTKETLAPLLLGIDIDIDIDFFLNLNICQILMFLKLRRNHFLKI